MKIAIISTAHPQKCGIATYTASLANTLKTLDHDVYLLAEKTEQSLPKESGVHRCWTRTKGLSPLIEYVDRANVDIVHIQHEFGLFPYSADLAYFVEALKTPTVITLHTPSLEPHMNLGGLALHSSLIVHSKKGALLYNAHYVPHGCNFYGYKSEKALRDGPILVAGFISPGKKIDKTIKAVIDASRAVGFIDKPLVVVGQDLTGHGQSLAHMLNTGDILGDSEIIAKYISDAELVGYYKKAALTILNRPSNTAYSASGQMAHALATGTPIFCRNTEMFKDHDGAAIEFDNWRDLSNLLQAVDFQTLKELSRRAEKVAAERSWMTIAEKHEEIYEDRLRRAL